MLFRVTDLDNLLWYHKLDDMSVDDVRARLLRTESPNEKMAIGTAWHSILENPPDIIDTVTKDGYTFKVECESQISLPQIREIRANKEYTIDGEMITLSGGCDGISGNIITDHKLTFNENVETYFDSYQWRTYLDIFNADEFIYWIYAANQKGNDITINHISSIKMFRYPEMVDDVKKGIRDLVTFVKQHVPELQRGY